MWEEKVNQILATHAPKRVNGRVASDRTQELTAAVVKAFFRKLHELGYKVQEPNNVGNRHLEIIVRHWWHDMKKKPKSIQNDLSRLRIFFGWIGKPGMVGAAATYLPEVDPKDLKVTTVATASKSWIEAGIDVQEKLGLARRLDMTFSLILMMQLWFGLRREEAILCRPHKADLGHSLRIYPYESKGSRPRLIPIETAGQRRVLDFVKSKVGKTKRLGWEYTDDGRLSTEKSMLRRYNHFMGRIGITKEDAGCTGHGLRAQYTENLALLDEFIPPTLGGTGSGLDKDELDVRREKISEALGHTRKSITGAYYGSFPRKLKDESEQVSEWIKQAAEILHRTEQLHQVDPGRKSACMLILMDLSDHGIEVTLSEAQGLWEVASKRFGAEWVEPSSGITESVGVAARWIVNQ